jgi:sulfoxide reductase catalytic subunit YedY
LAHSRKCRHTGIDFRQRRQLLKAAGFIGLSLAGIIPSGCGPAKDAAIIGAQEQPPARDLYPTHRDARFVLDRPLTEEVYAASYNNFYEFSVFKGSVYKKSARLRTAPWQVEVGGLVEKPRIFEVDELIRMMTLEERLYRFRCVEAWAMAVPWSGFSRIDDGDLPSSILGCSRACRRAELN